MPLDFPRLLDFGIGLTDLVKNQAGNDTAIQFDQVDRIRLTKALEEWQPRYLCFNGKRAAQEYFGSKPIAYGLQGQRVGRTGLFVAPSTSAAARASWDLRPWQELAALVAA
jgi:TDG/mug DNA glycosylase family protein